MLLPDMLPGPDAPDAAFPSALQWAFACVRSRAFVVSDKGDEASAWGGSTPAGGASPRGDEAGMGGAREGGDQVGQEPPTQELGNGDARGDEAPTKEARGGNTPTFQPSAAAVRQAKAAAKQSGGFAMLIPGKAKSPLVAAGGGASGAAALASHEAGAQVYRDDRFAFVPFLDMTNHDAEPNADFSCEGGTRYVLRALRPLKQGEEVLISYRKEMSNRIYQALYGFVPQGGNHNDDIEVPLSVLLGPQGAADEASQGIDFLRPLDHPKIKRLTAPLLEQALGLDEGNAEQILAKVRYSARLHTAPAQPTQKHSRAYPRSVCT
jgi:hypothetical protein